ncbi:MAG: exonuclease domain-containing protein, partial [Acidimicrobiales bacterium]
MPAAPWTSGELLCFDLETTGVDRFNDVPVSLALVRMVDGVPVQRTVELVNPGRAIPPGATAVHGITTEDARRLGLPLQDAVGMVVASLLDASRR